jgi:hypothetical protein
VKGGTTVDGGVGKRRCWRWAEEASDWYSWSLLCDGGGYL